MFRRISKKNFNPGQRFKIRSWGFLFFLLAQNTFAANLQGTMKEIEFFNCGRMFCLQITSPEAFLSKLHGHMSFKSSKLLIKNLETKDSLSLDSDDVYYDVAAKVVIIRKAGPERKQDYVLNIRDQKLTSYRY